MRSCQCGASGFHSETFLLKKLHTCYFIPLHQFWALYHLSKLSIFNSTTQVHVPANEIKTVSTSTVAYLQLTAPLIISL